MKKHLLIIISCGFLFSACLVVGPRRGSRRQQSKSRCHPSEYWTGHKCKHKKHKHKGKKHKGKGKGKGKKHKHRH